MVTSPRFPDWNHLRIEVSEEVALLTISRPKALNALSDALLKELSEALTLIAKAAEIRGLIITGEGRAFVAGADIVQMLPYKSEDGVAYAGFAQSVFNQIEDMGKPVIAAVNGFALGGGCELALSCDIRIASEKAVFGQPELKLGVIPCFGGTQRLSRLIGAGLSKELIFTGRQVKAQEAEKIGLVNRVVAPEALIIEARAMMSEITAMAPIALRYAKAAINGGLDMDLHNGLELEKTLAGLTYATEDKDEGMQAFLDKREPVFKGK